MHSFRPVFAQTPYATLAGHRLIPMWCVLYWRIVMHLQARLNLQTYFSQGSSHLLPKIARVRMNRCSSSTKHDQAAMLNSAETLQIPNFHAFVTRIASFTSCVAETDTHSRDFWQQPRPSIRIRGPVAPFFATTRATATSQATAIAPAASANNSSLAAGAGHAAPTSP